MEEVKIEGETELEVADQVEEVETPGGQEDNSEDGQVVSEDTQEGDVESDVSQEEEQEETVSEVKQSDEDNRVARLARLQAEKEAEEKAEKIRQEAYEKGLSQGKIHSFIGKVNPYTKNEIRDEYDAKEYLDMYELDEKGQDPLLGYVQLQKERSREEVSKKMELDKEESQRQWIANDAKAFSDVYSRDKLDELMQDDDFKAYAEGKLGNVPLLEIYDGYNKFISKYEKKASVEAKNTAKALVANSVASPGKISDGDADVDNWSTMSADKFEKYIQKARDGELRNR